MNYQINYFRPTLVQYVLVVITIFFSTRASNLANSPIALLIVDFLIISYCYLKRIRFSKYFYLLIIVILVYCLLIFLKFQIFTPLFYIRVLSLFMTGFIVLYLVNVNFIPIFVKVVYFVSILGLPFYFLGFFYYYPLLNFARFLSDIFSLNSNLSLEIDYSNFLIYTVRPYEERFRNSGFMWEPGAFGVITCIALYFNLFLTRFRLTKESSVLILSSLSTLSTTAFLMLSFISIFYIININRYLSILIFPVFLVIGLFLWDQDFMGPKIQELSSDPNEKLETFYNSKSQTGTQSLGRFAGLIYNFEGVKISPIFGIGSHEEILYKRSNVYLYSTNGLGQFMMTFGFVGLFLYLYTIYNSTLILSNFYGYKGFWTLFGILIVGGFSFLVVMSPIYSSILFISPIFSRALSEE